MTTPPPAALAEMVRALTVAGLDDRLGSHLFAPANWHQSLSHRYPAGTEIENRLLRAGERIAARAFTLTLNRFYGRGDSYPLHWAFLAKGRPPGFDNLLAAIRVALFEEGFPGASGHSPHVTISYSAPASLPSTNIAPIAWPISEVLLVEGGGTPYHYEALARWPLLPDPDAQLQQIDLF